MMHELAAERADDLAAAPAASRLAVSAAAVAAADHKAAVLVATETGDDAGVYLLDATAPVGVVQTADFITPPFDDPEGYGQIAAANALSDVYAMGGRPISALNLCVFPKQLPLSA